MDVKDKNHRSTPTPSQFRGEGFMRTGGKLKAAAGNVDGVGAGRPIPVPFLQETGLLKSGMHCNFFEIEEFTVANGRISLDAEISLTEKSSDIKMYAALYDARDESRPIAQYEMQEKKNVNGMHYVLDCPVDQTNLQAAGTDLTVIVKAEWAYAGGEESAAVMESTPYDPAEWEVVYPKKEEDGYVNWKADSSPVRIKTNKKKQDKIVLAMIRTPNDANDLDYLCQFGFKGKYENDWYPNLMIPCEGTVTFTDPGFKLDQDPVTMECFILNVDGNQGGAYFLGAGGGKYETGDIEMSVTTKKVHYWMYNAWEQTFLEKGKWAKHMFSYRMKLSYKVNGERRTLLLGDKVDGKRCIKSVPHLLIMWGCVEETTLILMADGTQKEIRNIEIGEEVALPDGGAQKVVNVWKGQDASYYRLRTKGGAEIRTDAHHPFPTKDSVKTPVQLSEHDMVFVWDASERRMREEELEAVEKIEGEINVCNLSLRGKKMIANGFISGDMDMQNNIKEG